MAANANIIMNNGVVDKLHHGANTAFIYLLREEGSIVAKGRLMLYGNVKYKQYHSVSFNTVSKIEIAQVSG